MKAYAIEKSLYSPKLSFFHYLLFHGQEISNPQYRREVDPCLGDDLSKPVYLIRNARQIPAAFEPGTNLVVSEGVKAKLEGLPHTVFLPVQFHKVVDFPAYSPGDNSFEDLPAYQEIISNDGVEKFLELLPDVPALHSSLPPYFELVLPRLGDITCNYSSLKSVRCSMKTAGGVRTEKFLLSPRMLDDYPVIWWSFTVFSESAFPLIAPSLDRDHFEVVELKI